MWCSNTRNVGRSGGAHTGLPTNYTLSCILINVKEILDILYGKACGA